jgi:hypothetical protein
MNIPVSNFGRDEAYTFICGIVIAITWYLYLVKINFIPTIKSMIDPFFIMLWLLSTAVLYIVYLIISISVIFCINRTLEKQGDDVIIEEQKVTKYFSLYFSGPLEEIRMGTHIQGLLTTSLLLLYQPLLDFFIGLSANFILIHFVYSGITIFLYCLFYRGMRNLLIIKRLISKGLCDTIDEKAYNKKRAELYAELKNNEYVERLKKQIKK